MIEEPAQPEQSGEQERRQGLSGDEAPVVTVRPPTCPNCGTVLMGLWCHECGQIQKRIDRFFYAQLGDVLDDVLTPNSRAARTLLVLLFRPGFLTSEYFAGRRVRYVPPLRLYIITSVAFFFVLSLQLFPAKDGPPGAKTAAVTYEDTTQGATADEAQDFSGLLKSLDGFEIVLLSAETNQSIRDRIRKQAEKAGQILKEDSGKMINAVIDAAPPIVFLILPLFALLLKVAYFRSGRFYAEHLVFAVHNHSFLYVVLLLDSIVIASEASFPTVAGVIRGGIRLWIPFYMYLSLRHVYRQGYVTTLLKFMVLAVCYNTLLIIGAGLAFLSGVMSL